ncbi:MAG: UMP kinase [Candidatus Verstraetearchaeota archaeon]|nr:UMP kinase [Candidatus Verstraetearchaeota archaeon]
MNITIKLSGHILFPSFDMHDLRPYAEVIKKIKNMGYMPYVVVGGGIPARYYINLARAHGADESTCDYIGISIANINARIFINALGEEACQFVPTNFKELDEAISTGKIVVMGGLQPGQSTTAVSSILAERTNSKLFIITTNIDGIYTKDPKKDPNAKKYDTITADELIKILESQGIKAGEYDLLDPVALKIIKRSKIITKVIDGREPINILKAVIGEKIGTTILP